MRRRHPRQFVLGGAGQGITMSKINIAPALELALAPEPAIHRIWPVAVIAFGLGLTAAWMGLLGYGLFKIIEMAI